MAFEMPGRGIVYWPVANGDSVTIVVDSERYIQLDLNHLEKSEDDAEPTWPVIDELVERLPVPDDAPYLSVLALTHPDEDHCRGFADLLARVSIGELWFTPRIFWEYKKDLSESAKAFKKEAERRVKSAIEAEGDPGSGNRVLVFGYSSLLETPEYKGFPKQFLVVPGNSITMIDGHDVSENFRGFAHSPFKDDIEGERNDTSLGLQVRLHDGVQHLEALLLGDLTYPAVKRIFDNSNPEDLAWHVFLAPHHCSKSVMYWQDEDSDEEELKQDLMDAIESAAHESNQIVSSSIPVPDSNEKGDNPPHAIAKNRYEEISKEFICTMENSGTDNPQPVVVSIIGGKVQFRASALSKMTAAQAASATRGRNNPPRRPHTYG